MASEGLVRISQIAAAALGFPAAAAATYSAYQTYFSAEVACHRLRTAIIVSLERNLRTETKRALLRKDVTDFNNTCGESDPDARAVFPGRNGRCRTSSQSGHSRGSCAAAGRGCAASAAASPRAAGISCWCLVLPGSGSITAGLHYRREAGSWIIQFSGRNLRNDVAARRAPY